MVLLKDQYGVAVNTKGCHLRDVDTWAKHPLTMISITFSETLATVVRSVILAVGLKDDANLPVTQLKNLAGCMGSDNKEQRQLATLVSCFLMWVLDRKFTTIVGLNMQAQFTRKCARLSQMNEARTFLTWSNKAEAPVHWTFAQCYHDLWMKEKEKYQRYVKEASQEYALVTRMHCVPESIRKKPKGDKSTFYLYKNDDGKATVFLEKLSPTKKLVYRNDTTWKELNFLAATKWTEDGFESGTIVPSRFCTVTYESNDTLSNLSSLTEGRSPIQFSSPPHQSPPRWQLISPQALHLNGKLPMLTPTPSGKDPRTASVPLIELLAVTTPAHAMDPTVSPQSLAVTTPAPTKDPTVSPQSLAVTTPAPSTKDSTFSPRSLAVTTPAPVPLRIFPNSAMQHNKNPKTAIVGLGASTTSPNKDPTMYPMLTPTPSGKDPSAASTALVEHLAVTTPAHAMDPTVSPQSLAVTTPAPTKDPTVSPQSLAVTTPAPSTKDSIISPRSLAVTTPAPVPLRIFPNSAMQHNKSTAVSQTSKPVIVGLGATTTSPNKDPCTKDRSAVEKRKRSGTKAGPTKKKKKKGGTITPTTKSKQNRGGASSSKTHQECGFPVAIVLPTLAKEWNASEAEGRPKSYIKSYKQTLAKEGGGRLEELRFCQLGCKRDLLDESNTYPTGCAFYARDFLKDGGCCQECFAKKSEEGFSKSRTRRKRMDYARLEKL